MTARILGCVLAWLICIMINAYLIGRMKFADSYSDKEGESGAIAAGIVVAPLFLTIVLLIAAGSKMYRLGRKHA